MITSAFPLRVVDSVAQRSGGDAFSFQLPIEDSYPAGPVDVDNDGIYEWTVVDHSWAYVGYPGCCSPYSSFILAWNGSAYVDATKRFPEGIDKGKSDPVPPPAGSDCEQKDLFMRDSISRYLDYWDSQRPDDAARILAALRDYGMGGLAGKRDVIADALSTSPHGPFTEIPFVSCPSYYISSGNMHGAVEINSTDPPYAGTTASISGLPSSGSQAGVGSIALIFFTTQKCNPSTEAAILYDRNLQAPVFLTDGQTVTGSLEAVNSVPEGNSSTSGFTGLFTELKAAAVVQLTSEWDPAQGIQPGGYNLLDCGPSL